MRAKKDRKRHYYYYMDFQLTVLVWPPLASTMCFCFCFGLLYSHLLPSSPLFLDLLASCEPVDFRPFSFCFCGYRWGLALSDFVHLSSTFFSFSVRGRELLYGITGASCWYGVYLMLRKPSRIGRLERERCTWVVVSRKSGAGSDEPWSVLFWK